MIGHNDFIKIDTAKKHYLVGFDRSLFALECKNDFIYLYPLGKNQNTIIQVTEYTKGKLKLYNLSISFVGRPREQATSLIIKPTRILDKHA